LGLVWGAVVWGWGAVWAAVGGGWGLICLWCGGGVGLFLVAGSDADWFGGILREHDEHFIVTVNGFLWSGHRGGCVRCLRTQ
jgi:hypothetical protein